MPATFLKYEQEQEGPDVSGYKVVDPYLVEQ